MSETDHHKQLVSAQLWPLRTSVENVLFLALSSKYLPAWESATFSLRVCTQPIFAGLD